MAVPKSSGGNTSQRKKHRTLEKPHLQPRSTELPAVIVRVKQHDVPVSLINIPQSSLGADLVLHMIGAHPEAEALTSDLAYVKFGDIVRVDCPERGELLIEEARKAVPEPAGSNAWIRVRHAARVEKDEDGKLNEVPIQVFNIPDSERGRALLREIFDKYGSRETHEYTLYTSENGHATVSSLAAANRPPR